MTKRRHGGPAACVYDARGLPLFLCRLVLPLLSSPAIAPVVASSVCSSPLARWKTFSHHLERRSTEFACWHVLSIAFPHTTRRGQHLVQPKRKFRFASSRVSLASSRQSTVASRTRPPVAPTHKHTYSPKKINSFPDDVSYVDGFPSSGLDSEVLSTISREVSKNGLFAVRVAMRSPGMSRGNRCGLVQRLRLSNKIRSRKMTIARLPRVKGDPTSKRSMSNIFPTLGSERT